MVWRRFTLERFVDIVMCFGGNSSGPMILMQPGKRCMTKETDIVEHRTVAKRIQVISIIATMLQILEFYSIYTSTPIVFQPYSKPADQLSTSALCASSYSAKEQQNHVISPL